VNRLLRDLAPVTDASWEQIDDEAARTLKSFLAARRLVDFNGPLGWDASCVADGRATAIEAPSGGVSALARQVRPLVELRAEFTLARAELDATDRGAQDIDLSPLVEAARNVALAEDGLVFNGSAAADVTGIAAGSPHQAVELDEDYGAFARRVAHAVAMLREAGVDGPYAVALGPRCYTGVVETTEHGGYPVLEHVRLVAGGPVVWAPAVNGSVVLSLRGGDFRLTVGGDLSLGYVSHDAESVTLRIDESLTFSNDSPEAAIALRYPT
jgi:uncharacterized linocin/CFP29 family protein